MNALVFVFAALAATCYGQTHEELSKVLFDAMDTDKNGQITIQEMEGQFNTLDMHGHGHVSRHDFTQFVCALYPTIYNLSHHLYDQMDLHSDHKMEKDDYDLLFTKVDTDKSGAVSPTELDTFFASTFTTYGAVTHQHSHSGHHGHCH